MEFLAKLIGAVARKNLLDEKMVASVTFAEFKPTLLAYLRVKHSQLVRTCR